MGVPQGTVLGPILFLVYMNNITKIKDFVGHIVCYADDTAVVFTGNNWSEVKSTAESDLKKIQLWFNHNLLSINIGKTKYLTFSPSVVDQPKHFSLKFHSSNCHVSACHCPDLSKSSSVKYLGIIIDQHLRWKEQINQVTRRIRALMHKFYILREMVSRKNLVILYNSLAESLIRYCVVVWGGAFSSTIKSLQTAQNTLLKIIFKKNKLFSTKLLYEDSGLLNVRTIFTYQCILRVFHKQAKFNIKNTRTTRYTHQKNLHLDFFRKSVSKRSFLYYGPKLFNLIPTNLREENNPKRFKLKVKEFILKHKERFKIE